MSHRFQHSTARKIAFFLILLLACAPIVAFHLTSANYHSLHNNPVPVDGVLDLAGCDLSSSQGVPLDGRWEFYHGQFIHGEADPGAPDRLVKVPLPWSRFAQEGGVLPKDGISSYRLYLENCPGGIPLTVYIPNISAAYRIYLNGTLIAGRSLHAFEESEYQTDGRWNVYREYRKGLTVPEGSRAEVIVELRSTHIGGLYITPLLADANLDTQRSELRRFVIAAYVGILLLCITGFGVILLMRDRSFPSAALLVLDILVLVRILFMDEFFQITWLLLSISQQYTLNSALQALTLFLPVAFLFAIRQMVHLEVSRRVLVATMLYELTFAAAILWCAATGQPVVQYILCQFSYLPLIYVLARLYRSVLRGEPRALLVSAILMLNTSCIMGANLKASGILVTNISLFAPTCFVLSVLLQVFMYVQKNQEIQCAALEAEKLALQLKESRMALMLSQIKPHFLYNTLIAIHMLCLEAPAEAAEATLTFSDYLRSNMRSISSETPIPFSQELSHIKSYASIEKLRFGERLTVVTEIGETDFRVPPLSIQPIVENAIKHGACKNLAGGTVTLRTWADEGSWRVEVRDDGPGFDPALLSTPRADSFGLNNIMLRLREWMGAEVTIQSAPGEGTVVTVALPKEVTHESHSH